MRSSRKGGLGRDLDADKSSAKRGDVGHLDDGTALAVFICVPTQSSAASRVSRHRVLRIGAFILSGLIMP